MRPGESHPSPGWREARLVPHDEMRVRLDGRCEEMATRSDLASPLHRWASDPSGRATLSAQKCSSVVVQSLGFQPYWLRLAGTPPTQYRALPSASAILDCSIKVSSCPAPLPKAQGLPRVWMFLDPD